MRTKGKTTAVDVAIGGRIYLRRKQIGWTQSKLADAIGVTFQQVQKYESGANRITCGRLVEIAAALDTTVENIFGPLYCSIDDPLYEYYALLTNPGVVELIRTYDSLSTTARESVRYVAYLPVGAD